MKADNDNARTVGGATPLGTRLARAGRRGDLLRYVRYGTVPAEPTWLSATSNLPEVESKPQADRVTEIKPNAKGEMSRIIQWMEAGEEGVKTNSQGHIVEWRGADGKFRPVVEMYRQPKGKRRKSEEERRDDNVRHLAIRGSGGFPELSTYVERKSGGTDYWRLRHAFMCKAMTACNDNRRQEIDRLGVGGRNSFDEAWSNADLYPACRLPRHVTVIARGAEFLARRVHSNLRAAKGGVEGGHDLVERQIVETMDAPRIDTALGDHALVLDLSIAGLTAREIAVRLGWGDTKAAERRAVAAQDTALAALADVEAKLAA
jgi:hypothetical protein